MPLTPVLKDYEYVILDTPPSLGILTGECIGGLDAFARAPFKQRTSRIEGTDDLLETYERIPGTSQPGAESSGRGDYAF